MTNLFTQIAELVVRCHGWATVEKCLLLASSVVTLRPQTSVIIGVWGGRDTFALALAHKEIGKGKVLAIDPWVAAASVQGQDNQADRDWWSNSKMHNDVYFDFLEKRGQLGLNEIIEVQRMTSEYATVPKVIDGCLVIDGNHGPTAIQDVERFAPVVSSGAFLLLDDVHWTGGYVEKGREKLLDMGFRSLLRIDTSEWFQKI